MDLIERLVPFVPYPVVDEPVVAYGRITKAVWWQSIEQILTAWESCDGGSPEGCPWGSTCNWALGGHVPDEHTIWQCLLAAKRDDPWFRDVRFSVMEHGIVRPFTIDLSLDWEGNVHTSAGEFGDGHHRLAACIDLGYTHIPVHVCVDDCSHPYAGLNSMDWRRYLEGNTR